MRASAETVAAAVVAKEQDKAPLPREAKDNRASVSIPWKRSRKDSTSLAREKLARSWPGGVKVARIRARFGSGVTTRVHPQLHRSRVDVPPLASSLIYIEY